MCESGERRAEERRGVRVERGDQRCERKAANRKSIRGRY